MNIKSNFSFLKNIRAMVLVSLFIAVYVVLSLFRIYITSELRISLTFMPVAWASMLFGPLAGALTGAIGDVLGWAINPVGPYFPGFTISGFITGIIYGVFLYKKQIAWARVISAAVLMIVIVEIGLNSIWMNMLAGIPYKILIITRLIKALITIPLQMFILYSTGYIVKKIAPTSIHRV